MKESFKRQENSHEPVRLSRRNFLGLLGGGMSAAALSGIPAAKLLTREADVGEPAYDSDELSDLLLREERRESKEGLSNSKHFIMEIVAHADRYERELPVVLRLAQEKTTKDQEGRTRMQYLHEMLHADDVPEAAMREIKKQIVGLGFEESRYDAARESGEGALGILQIMPATWEDLKKEGEHVYSLVDQTRVAGELLSQTYAHLQTTVGDELSTIKAEFFNGDEDAFAQYFLAPVLINAYNAGMGTMARLIAWFARTYGTEEKTVGLFGQEEKLSGYDVFMAMAQKGNTEHAVPLYREDASAYTFKVYGAALCLLRHPDVVLHT